MIDSGINWEKNNQWINGYASNNGRRIYAIKTPLLDSPPSDCPYELYNEYTDLIGKFRHPWYAEMAAQGLYHWRLTNEY